MCTLHVYIKHIHIGAATAAKSLQSCLTLCGPHRQQPTRLPHLWDSPGKNTGVGCHCLLQCMKVKSANEATQSCPTLHDPMDCSLPGSSVHEIFQPTVLEGVAIAFSRVIFPTQGLNPGLLHYRQMLYHLSHQGSPYF